MKAKAIVFKAPFQIETGEIEIPELKDRDVLVETLYTLISPGTELRVLAGREPNANKFPLIPGYSLVGRIIKRGSQVEMPLDSLVFISNADYFHECKSGWGAHISHVVCDSSNVIPVPDGISPIDATFTAVLAVACHGASRVRVNEGDKVVITGQGLIGQLALQVFKALKTQVVAVDIEPSRISLSKTCGADYAINAGDGDTGKSLAAIWKDGADVVVDVTGIASAVSEGAKLLRAKSWEREEDANPKFLLLGSYAGDVCFDYFSFLFPKEPDIYVSRATNSADKNKALELLGSKKVDVKKLVSEVFPYQKAMHAYSELKDNPGRYMTFAFKW